MFTHEVMHILTAVSKPNDVSRSQAITYAYNVYSSTMCSKKTGPPNSWR